MAGNTYTVSTTVELEAILKTATGGDVIELAAGQYGHLDLSHLTYASNVTIKSADTDGAAIFNSINAYNVSNITFDGLVFDFIPDEDTKEFDSALRLSSSSDVVIKNSIFEGGPAVAGISADAEAGTQGNDGILGEPIGRAIMLYDSSDITIESNDISEFTKGIVLGGGENITIHQNDIHDLRSSPVTGTVDSGLTVSENYFHDFHPWKLGGAGDHGDYVHIWTTPDQTDPITDISITNNFFAEGDGESLLGVYLDDNTNDLGFSGVTIDGNVIHLGDKQAIRLEDVNGGVISNNTLLQSSGDDTDTPGIGLHDSSNLTITNNLMSRDLYGSSMDDPDASGINASGNLVVQYTDPDGENYAGTLFAQSTQPGFPLQNLQAIPGSAADGVGSLLTQPDTTPDTLSPSFQVFSDAGGSENSLVFDATHTYGPAGQMDTDGARFLWDFGDGATAEGLNGTHTYETAGNYTVTLTVIDKTSGAHVVTTADVAIAGEDILTLDTATGSFKTQAYAIESAVEDSHIASFSTETGKVVDLGGTGTAVSIDKDKLATFFGAESFDLSLSLQADIPGESWGEVARIHGSFVINVLENGALEVQLTTASGTTTKLNTGTIVVNDGLPHDIQLSLSGDTDTFVVSVDGRVAAAEAIYDPMPDMASWGLSFGNPWGKQNFDGKLIAFDLDAPSVGYPAYPAATPSFTSETEGTGSDPAPTDTPDPVVDPTEPDAPDSSGEEATEAQIIDDYILQMAELDITRLKNGATLEEAGGETLIRLEERKDHVSLGRLEEFEDTDQLSFAVQFQKAHADGSDMRLVWNHTHIGLVVEDDGLRLYLGQTGNPFHKSIHIDDLGLDDTERHEARVIVDDTTDHLQVILDGDVVYEEVAARDIEVSGTSDKQWGWTLGSAWGHHFDGDIYDFRIEDGADFVATYPDDTVLLA